MPGIYSARTGAGFVSVFLLLMRVTDTSVAADFLGSDYCARCYQAETMAWQGSHHDLAMAEASPELSATAAFRAS